MQESTDRPIGPNSNSRIHRPLNRSEFVKWMVKLNIFSHLTDYGLSGHMVFDHDQIRPAGKMYLKTQSCNKLILCNHFTWLIPYESCRLWRNDYVMIFILRYHYVIGRIWVILRNILIILFTIRTATRTSTLNIATMTWW